MTEAYTRFLEEKLVKAESLLNYAQTRLREISIKYDAPFVPDQMRELLAEINRVKNNINNEISNNDAAIN